VKIDSTLTLTPNAEAIRASKTSAIPGCVHAAGTSFCSWEADQDGDKDVETTGLLYPGHSSFQSASVRPTHLFLTLRTIPHRGWGDTEAIGWNRVSRATCNRRCFCAFCHRNLNSSHPCDRVPLAIATHCLRTDDVARGVVVAMNSILNHEIHRSRRKSLHRRRSAQLSQRLFAVESPVPFCSTTILETSVVWSRCLGSLSYEPATSRALAFSSIVPA
jgi:hypothetical protein